MKTVIIFFFALFVCSNCEKFSPLGADNLPLSVSLGKSKFYLNGEEISLRSRIIKFDSFEYISYFFSNEINGMTFFVDLGTIVPFAPGNYTNFMSISQYKGDKLFQEYKLSNEDSPFFKVESVDSISMEVSGAFQGKFIRTFQNRESARNRLPHEIVVQGVFHEKYTNF